MSDERLANRLQMLGAIENRFIREKRGQLPKDHREIIGKSVQLMTSSQLAAFKRFRGASGLCVRDTEKQILGGAV